MTIREILTEGKKLLKAPSASSVIDTPDLDASLLLAETLHYSREELIIRLNEPITEPAEEKYLGFLERRRSGECVAYILGRREFRGLEFIVNPRVLIPRPETEILVEAALEYIDSQINTAGNSYRYSSHRDAKTYRYSSHRDAKAQRQELGSKDLYSSSPGIDKLKKTCREKNFYILDLCTGSGALAVSLKRERSFLKITASDISNEALEIAALNAERLLGGGIQISAMDARLSQNHLLNENGAVHFIASDLFDGITGKFNIIVSNPPYIPTGEIDRLTPEVHREPRLALDGGRDGLKLIRKIISKAGDRLLPGGILLLEAAPEQMPEIKTLLEGHGFGDISIHRDLAGKERVISGKKQN